MLFYNPSQKFDIRSLRPSPSQMATLGNAYFTRVDPVFKVLHRPSTLSLLYSTAQDYSSCSPSQEALLFSIYYIAVTATPDEDCESKFGRPRCELLTRFNSGFHQALANADFLNTTELSTLQAFVIYIVSTFGLFAAYVDNGRSISSPQANALRRLLSVFTASLGRNGPYLHLQ